MANLTGTPVALTFDIEKVDEEKRQVWGIATAEVLDKQRDIVDYDASKRAFAAWPGNVREQHDPKKAIGKAIAVIPDDDKRQIRVGVQISKTRDGEDTWTKVREGILKMFSIKGEVFDSAPVMAKADNGGTVAATLVKDYRLDELSLVDNGAQPVANVQMIKSADGVSQATDVLEAIADALAIEKQAEAPSVKVTLPEGLSSETMQAISKGIDELVRNHILAANALAKASGMPDDADGQTKADTDGQVDQRGGAENKGDTNTSGAGDQDGADKTDDRDSAGSHGTGDDVGNDRVRDAAAADGGAHDDLGGQSSNDTKKAAAPGRLGRALEKAALPDPAGAASLLERLQAAIDSEAPQDGDGDATHAQLVKSAASALASVLRDAPSSLEKGANGATKTAVMVKAEWESSVTALVGAELTKAGFAKADALAKVLGDFQKVTDRVGALEKAAQRLDELEGRLKTVEETPAADPNAPVIRVEKLIGESPMHAVTGKGLEKGLRTQLEDAMKTADPMTKQKLGAVLALDDMREIYGIRR